MHFRSKYVSISLVPLMPYTTLCIGVTLKSRLGVTQGHWKWHHLVDHIRLHYSSSIVTMAVSCTVFEIKQNIGRKRQFFIVAFHLTCTITLNPLSFLPKILIQTTRVPKLLHDAKILPKSSSLCRA